MKQVCIIGLGRFGSHLAKSLAELNCEVLAVDSDENKVQEIRDYVQHAVIADARNYNDLVKVVSPDIDAAVVSFGGDMESSILCALHLKKLGVKIIWAKASNPDHAHILNLIGVDEIISPEKYTAERIAARMMMPNYLDFLPITEDFRVAELTIPEVFNNRTIGELQLRNEYNVMVLAIKKPETGKITFMPGATVILENNDVIVIVGRKDDINRLSNAH